MGFFLDIIVIFGIFILLAVGLDLIVGFTGILSIGHAAFYAVGAYVAALLAQHAGLSFLPATLLAMLAAGIVAAIIALPVFRISGDFLIILTLGFGEIMKSILMNWPEVTGGVRGLRNIPSMRVFSVDILSVNNFLLIEWVFIAAILFVLWRIKRSALGAALKGIRDDELSMQTLGFNTFYYKMLAFFLGGAIAGVAGSLFANYRGYISPQSFGLETSVLVFCMCVIGGMGTVWGSIAGAFIFWSLPELLRLTGSATFDAATWRQLVLGLILILVMIFRPRGILGERIVKN